MTYDGTMPQIEDSELPLYGENVARTLEITGNIRGSSVAKSIKRNIHLLRELHSSLEPEFSGGEVVPSYIEWLLDNFYLAQREGIQASNQLQSCGRIPESNGSASLFTLCIALLRSDNGKATPERCRLFLQGCQHVYVLSRRELMNFVPFLKAAVVSELTLLYSSEIDEVNTAFSAERLFSTLRSLSTLDFSDILEEVDKTEQTLRCDPAKVYPLMHEKTRNQYKKRVERLAKAYHVSEHRIAEHVLGLSQNADSEARHVGYWLFTRPMGEKKALRSGGVYISLNILLTLLFTLLIAFTVRSVVAGFLLVLPMSELVKNLMDVILLRFTPPAHVPRMELEEGVPPVGRTICVISALLTNEKCGLSLARRLEEFRLANRNCGENLLFGILADLKDANTKVTPEDEKYIDTAKAAIDNLNKKYGGGFFFFIRERSYNKPDKCYTAWERKRGAIVELAGLLCEKDTGLKCLSGNYLSLRGVHYIMTLDEDTRLTPGTAKELIGAMLHPLNTPVVDEKAKKVVSGHAIIHPRISVELSSCNRSHFAKVFAGHGGTDPYGSDSSELYMDAFDSGGFAGKGIIDAEVFTECMRDRIPDNRVLSHDAIEGAFLRGAYMGDTELTDKFPSDILSYFRRLHRWTRGDWQNLPWIFRRGRFLRDIDRFKLFDSIRRSLVAPLTFLAFACAFFAPTVGTKIAALFALLSFAFHLIIISLRNLFLDAREARVRCHSAVIHGVGGALIETEFKLIFLPFEAYVCAAATVTALWRMTVSHRSLLNWTPASAFEGKSNGALKYYRSMWVSPVIALIFIIFAPTVIGIACGIVWLFSPLVAMSISKPLVRNKSISENDRNYLLLCAKQIWSFFEDFCTAEDHFLPPDNWQERPPVGLAHRTSPTNIGLCLLSCLSAIDLNIGRPEAALGIIENILATLRRMTKWNGHLYNWYDTGTLKPLHPAYVSTVDSGNLATCLVILREGLLEFGRPDLAVHCDELLAPMSFEPFYNENHHLFSIGIDTDKELITNSFYDLMASEARTAGFFAISRGDIPRRHWKSLSRAQVEKDGYRGMVSWTGSMFEYLMPRLFFESSEGSLMYESMKFAVGVQKKRGNSKHVPWGISESAFYALDPALSYRYKAHGCGALALKRNMNSELVISAYSSFLALCCGVKSVVSNLRKLERYDAIGKYGFWEAIDFTESRTNGKNGEIVYCVMAHHLGMSLVAIDNALCENVMPHRLMRDPSMSAHSCLLDEKLPLGGVLLHRAENKLPEKPPKAFSVFWENHGDFTDFESPVCGLISNGEYNIMLTDSGVALTRCGSLTPYFTSGDSLHCEHGVELWLKRGNDLLPLLPSRTADRSANYGWGFTFSDAIISTEQADIRSQVSFSISASSNGEKRVVSVSTLNGESQDCELIVMFEPVLAPFSDYVNHPALYKHGMHAKMKPNTLINRRLEREKIPECYLCFTASAPMEISVKRGLVPGRGGLLQAIDEHIPSALGWLTDPMVCAKIPLRISNVAESVITIAIAVGESENEAYTSAIRILASDNSDIADFPADSASRIRLSEAQASGAMELLNTLSFPAASKSEFCASHHELWRFAISGDLPIMSMTVNGADDLDDVETIIKQHAFFEALSFDFDLVLITNEGGDYMRPTATAIGELIRSIGNESSNIHIIDSCADVDCILQNSVHPRERASIGENREYIMSTSVHAPKQNIPEYNWLDDNSFQFYVNQSLPPRSWENILTNGRFGFLATDCGTGHMWFGNAREYRINRWLCDSLTTRGTEIIELNHQSLFATAEDTKSEVTFGFGFAKWQKAIDNRTITTTAFVPLDTDARVLIVEASDGGSLPLSWCTDLVLCGDDGNASRVRVKQADGVFTATSPESPLPDSPFRVCSSAEIRGFTTDHSLWMQGKTDNLCEAGGFLGICFESSSPFVLVCGCEEADKLRELCSFEAAKEALKNTIRSWHNTVSGLKIKTPLPALDRLINGWLPYQTIACRLMGRCSIYQSGGATGFRDQLQDSVNVLLLNPAPAKAQILESCKHQYEQGDVMHWWHTLGSEAKGVRTHCSDDLLWLPWALCEYIEKTGDISLCEMSVPWLISQPLRSDEHDRYERAVYTETSSTVLEHSQRVIDLIIERGSGDHGLLKIGNGDWNDGMNKVGDLGKGESEWLTWFFSHTTHRFANLLRTLERTDDAEKYETAAKAFGQSANSAWDGEWYLRGYFDSGTPLGSKSQPCCQIDSIAQSFASLSPEAEKSRVNQALSSAVLRLFNRENRFICLFSPPFEKANPDPGYIESYGPGFRENGGQYTHGAVWLVMALIRENRSDEAIELIEGLLPENRSLSVYEAEPFVLAADISGNPDCIGKAGWSWYTGSAGWFYRIITEDLLGIKMQDGAISVTPNLPSTWQDFELIFLDKSGKENSFVISNNSSTTTINISDKIIPPDSEI